MKFRWKLLITGAIICVSIIVGGVRGQADELSVAMVLEDNAINRSVHLTAWGSITERTFEHGTVQNLLNQDIEGSEDFATTLSLLEDISGLSNGIIDKDYLQENYTPEVQETLWKLSKELDSESIAVMAREYGANTDGNPDKNIIISEKSYSIEEFLNTKLKDVTGFLQRYPSGDIARYMFYWEDYDKKNDSSQMTVTYTSSDNQAAVPETKTITGYAGEVLPTDKIIPKIPGYVADRQTLQMADPANSNQSVTVHYQKIPATIVTPTQPTSTEQPAEFQPFAVYGKQKLYRYSRPTFTHATRLQGYAKKAKAYAPQFKVVGTAQSTQGRLRYRLDDGTYITARPEYVAKLHWQSLYHRLYVTHPQGLRAYADAKMSQPAQWLKQGTAVTVSQIVRRGTETRFVLSDGTYISGSKQWVSTTQPRQVTGLKVRRPVRLSRDVDGKNVLQTLKRGAILKVTGWDYTRRTDTQQQGVKRYRTTQGYVTANSKFVTVMMAK